MIFRQFASAAGCVRSVIFAQNCRPAISKFWPKFTFLLEQQFLLNRVTWPLPRPTIPRFDSVTYFRPGSCSGKISFKFSDKKGQLFTLTARNFFGGNFIKIMKTYVNGNTFQLSLLQKWRRDVLVQ